jgi:hypothetical protein
VLALSGFGLLAAGIEAQSLYPPEFKMQYKVRLEKSVMVPMRDGLKLSTDLYIPEAAGEKLPVILIRTPYNKSSEAFWNFRSPKSVAYYFATHGYVVAVQDTRGKFESEGVYTVSAPDTDDGDASVTWAATQPWSSGKVGTYGCSYLGEDQMEMAKRKNPHLAAMIPQAAGGSDRYFGLVNGGAIELAAGFGWFRVHGAKYAPKVPTNIENEQFVRTAQYFNFLPVLPKIDFQKMWLLLPLNKMMETAGAPPSDWVDFLSHAPNDPWWRKFGYVQPSDHFSAPALHINSWYDIGVGDTIKLFNLMRTNGDSTEGRDNQFMAISPTSHCVSELATADTVVGARHLGDARFDYYNLYLRWFDYWLKGVDNGVTRMPKVQIYVMGRNQWRGENEFPLARTQWTKFYLHSNGHANSRFGTGTLSTELPGDEPPDQYSYDPKSPVPTLGGPICCTGTEDAIPGGFDQSEIEMRQDVLVYTTSVLKTGLEVTGPLKVILNVSSSALDTDFTAKLVDIYPDGTAYNVQDGILRARYREGYDHAARMKPEGTYELTIDLQATSNYFGPGHRIRLEISSSNFPRFDRNLNTGGNNYDETAWITAVNTIHHSRIQPSYILLPIIPEDSGGVPIATHREPGP